MFHQADNSIGGEIYNAFIYRNTEWKNHIHKAFEFVLALSGKIETVVDGKPYSLNEGECVMILPYQSHSLVANDKSKMLVIVFSESFVQSFASTLSNKTPFTAKFVMREEVMRFVLATLGKSKDSDDVCIKVEQPSTLLAKSALYAVCSEFARQTDFVARNYDSSLVYSILDYIEKNFTTDITLLSLSRSLGYDHRYLSRVFSSTFKMNFKTLVNQYRCDYAQKLITTTPNSLSDIAFSSGFQSIRSFNRAFKEIMGVYPSVLRK